MRMTSLFILLFSILFFSNILLGEDIKALDGTIYKNAEVLNTMPDGILVNFAGKDGFNTVKLLKFNDLPVSIQKKYGYNTEKAKTYKEEHNKWLNKQQALEEKKKDVAQQEQKKLDTKTKQNDNNIYKNEPPKEKLDDLIESLDKTSDNK